METDATPTPAATGTGATHGIRRTVHLDLDAGEAWRLIGTGDGWREWLADEVAVDLRDGAVGEVVDDGRSRVTRIEEVVEGESVTFVWTDDEGGASRVTLHLDEDHRGRRVLHITEVPVAACADCPTRDGARWDVRACMLCVAALTASRV